MLRKVLVTGGCGFIGRHVCLELLNRGYLVDVIDLKYDAELESLGAHIIQGDVRDIEHYADNQSGYESIYHLSGLLGTSELFADPVKAVEVNIIGALRVLLYAQNVKKIKIFFPSKPNEWNNIYSVTSQAIEKLGLSYREFYDLDVRILKLWNVYGPFQNTELTRKVVPTWIKSAITNEAIEIYGDGKQLINNIYVIDAAKYIIDYMELNGLTSIPMEIKAVHQLTANELAVAIKRITNNSGSELKYLPMRIGEKNNCTFKSYPFIDDLLGKYYKTDFCEAMINTVLWYTKNMLT